MSTHWSPGFSCRCAGWAGSRARRRRRLGGRLRRRSWSPSSCPPSASAARPWPSTRAAGTSRCSGSRRRPTPPPWPASRTCPRTCPNARTRALEVAARNGYDNTGRQRRVTVELGDKADPAQGDDHRASSRTRSAPSSASPQTTISGAARPTTRVRPPWAAPATPSATSPTPATGGASATPNGTAQGASPPGQLPAHAAVLGDRRGPGDRQGAGRPLPDQGVRGQRRRRVHQRQQRRVRRVRLRLRGEGGGREPSGHRSTCSSTTRCSSAPGQTCESLPPASDFPERHRQHRTRYVTRTTTRGTVTADDGAHAGAATAPVTASRATGSGANPQPRHDHLVRAAPADRHPEPQGRAGPERHRRQRRASSSTAPTTSAAPTSRPTSSRAAAAATTTRSPRQFHNWVSCAPSRRRARATTTCRCAPTCPWAARAARYIRSGNTARGGADRATRLER